MNIDRSYLSELLPKTIYKSLNNKGFLGGSEILKEENWRKESMYLFIYIDNKKIDCLFQINS